MVPSDLLAEMKKAVADAESVTGLQAKSQMWSGEEDPLHYYFSLVLCIPRDESCDAVFGAIKAALSRVYDFVNANCGRHFVRVEPEIQTDIEFDTKLRRIAGFMRGSAADLSSSHAQIVRPEYPTKIPYLGAA